MDERGFHSWKGILILVFSRMSRPALMAIQHAIQWITRFFREVQSGRGFKLTTNIYPILRSRISGITPLFPLYDFLA